MKVPALLAATSILLLAGCSSSAQGGTAAAETPAASATITPAPTSVVASSSAPDPVPAGPLKLGKRVTIVDGKADVTALAYRQPVATAIEPNSPGTEWGSLQARVCLHGTSSTVSNQPWLLLYADGSQYEPSNISYNQFPQPKYPIGFEGQRPLKAGSCAKGWITFPVTKGKHPTRVSYYVEDLAEPIEWAIR